MINKFENQTYELTSEEIKMLKPITNGFLNHKGKDKVITGKEICKSLNAKFGSKLTDVRLRKIVNHLRQEGYPILASANGYYYSENPEEILEQVKSLEQRADGILNARNGLMKIYKNIKYTGS